MSLTPINMDGIFSLNPGDRQLALSKAVVPPVDPWTENDTSQTSTSGTNGTTRTSSVKSTKIAAASNSSSDHLEDIHVHVHVLTLPKVKPKKGPGQKKAGLTTNVLSGSPFLAKLWKKKADKVEIEAQKRKSSYSTLIITFTCRYPSL